MQKICMECGAPFTCGHEEGECWCNDFPPIMPLDFKKGCCCPACLKKAIKAKINEFVKTVTPANAKNCLPPNIVQNTKLLEGIDFEIENGNYVFSKWYHLKRGYCCKNGCVNCPY